MPLIETEADLKEFFDTETGFAIVVRVVGTNFDIRFPAIVDDGTAAVPLYETEVEAPHVAFLAVDIDLVGVKTGMTVTFPDVDPADPIHARLIGKSFTVKRIASADPGTSTVWLKE